MHEARKLFSRCSSVDRCTRDSFQILDLRHQWSQLKQYVTLLLLFETEYGHVDQAAAEQTFIPRLK